jgi:phosphopantetheinyl transferase (holo-ACP synthase)
MKSAGNDIVALKSVDKKRTEQYKFYSKILSPSEQALYHQAQFAEVPFETYVWLLWSVKESVYKYLKRTNPGLIFSPTNTIVHHIQIPAKYSIAGSNECFQWESSHDDEFIEGQVVCKSHILYFRSKITDEWINTIVDEDEDFENVCWGVKSIDSTSYDHQSKAARTSLLNKLGPLFPTPLQIEKSPVGYPVILCGSQDIQVPASLAHDGHFVAYSFALNFGEI